MHILYRKVNVENMREFVMTVGISGSGKSRWCYENYNAATDVILDSDEIREELWNDANDQQNPDKVFSEMFSRAKMALLNQCSVYYCATNLNMRHRIHTLKQIKRCFPDVQCRAIVFNTPLFICKEWNTKRERQVPDWLFERQMKSFQMPVYNEGWDVIEVITPAEYDAKKFAENMWNDVRAVGSQDNPHHSRTLYDHLMYCLKKVDTSNLPEEEWVNMYAAAGAHDIGKAYTRSYDDNGVAHYYSHDSYGAFLAMNIKLPIEVIQLVCYHMKPYDANASSVWEKRLGEELWRKILILYEADKAAH